jgi:Na+:H+ antiporter, NhaA family
MSIFITLLAFSNSDVVNNSKIAILIASLVAGTLGFIFLKLTHKTKIENDES